MRRQFSGMGLAPGQVSAKSAEARAARHAGAARCFGAAQGALAGFGRDAHVFGLTKGQFSMIDLTTAILDRIGPADISLWTWCIASYEVEAVSAFIADGRVRRLRMVMDWTGAQRDMPLVGDLQARFGTDCIRVTKTHAKIVMAATDDGWRVVIRGSMNLNANPRFEQFDVSDDPGVFGVVAGIMDEMWARAPALSVRAMRHADAAALLDAGGPAPPPAWAPQQRQWW